MRKTNENSKTQNTKNCSGSQKSTTKNCGGKGCGKNTKNCK